MQDVRVVSAVWGTLVHVGRHVAGTDHILSIEEGDTMAVGIHTCDSVDAAAFNCFRSSADNSACRGQEEKKVVIVK